MSSMPLGLALAMTDSRASQVDLAVTPYYHCISRCVRRAYLCGEDALSGRSFEHRKVWLVDRIRFLGDVFAVDLCAYAVMSNHFHLVLRVREERARGWSETQVVRRYGHLYPRAVGRLTELTPRERTRRIEVFRSRLSDLSWMMRALNEWLARKANKEDGVKGRFWEGRFKSQALLDERALLTCMAYVDLNPVRAGVATTLEASEYTSIEQRLREGGAARALTPRKRNRGDLRRHSSLANFQDQVPAHCAREALPMLFSDYLAMLYWTGRAIHPAKPGRIVGPPPAPLRDIQVDTARWLETMQHYGRRFFRTVGAYEEVERHAARKGKAWVRGQGWAKQLFVTA